jgi:primosomal protein N' (replication factor Y)
MRLFSDQPADERNCTHAVRVAFPVGLDREFDYLVPDELWPVEDGQRLIVPFGRGNKKKEGFCVEHVPMPTAEDVKKYKKIISTAEDTPLLDKELLALARWISRYYVCPLGQVLAAMLPSAVKKGAGIKNKKFLYLADESQSPEKPRGQKQLAVVEYLKNRSALDENSALDIAEICTAADCSPVTVKSLIKKKLLNIEIRQHIDSLPLLDVPWELDDKPFNLNDDQLKSLDWAKQNLDAGIFKVGVLWGVTDSGKTEVYIRAIEHALAKGKSAIVLVPEIALTTQTVQRFRKRFNDLAVLHSAMTPAQRSAQWHRLKAGHVNLVIGARSAIFAPVPNLGLVIVDEEHDQSYKQDTTPRYNARDVAVKRAHLTNAVCILASATPSLESIENCKHRDHFNLLKLPKRVKDLPMPTMKLIDLRNDPGVASGRKLLSDQLETHLRTALQNRSQAILLLNRRGYSHFIFCPSCKYTLKCRNCEVSLTFHRRNFNSQMHTKLNRHRTTGQAVCHYCMSKTLVPEKCPVCGKKMAMIGMGAQRLEEELKRRFPKANIARVDSDSMNRKDYHTVLADFANGKTDILCGTQMLAKGLHFPNVTVVGIISADTALNVPDFRSSERTFQMICQVAGRCGRGEKPGSVFVQTFLPDQPAIDFAMHHDFANFAHAEAEHRKACKLPPHYRLAAILLKDQNYDKVKNAAAAMRARVDACAASLADELIINGPVPAPISRIQQDHRIHIIIQAPTSQAMNTLFTKIRNLPPLTPTVKIAIDIDPITIL